MFNGDWNIIDTPTRNKKRVTKPCNNIDCLVLANTSGSMKYLKPRIRNNGKRFLSQNLKVFDITNLNSVEFN